MIELPEGIPPEEMVAIQAVAAKIEARIAEAVEGARVAGAASEREAILSMLKTADSLAALTPDAFPNEEALRFFITGVKASAERIRRGDHHRMPLPGDFEQGVKLAEKAGLIKTRGEGDDMELAITPEGLKFIEDRAESVGMDLSEVGQMTFEEFLDRLGVGDPLKRNPKAEG